MALSRRTRDPRPLAHRFLVGAVLVAYLAVTAMPVTLIAQGSSTHFSCNNSSCCCGNVPQCCCQHGANPVAEPEKAVPSCCGKQSPTVKVVSGVNVLRCRGINLFTASGVVAVSPPRVMTWVHACETRDWLTSIDLHARGVVGEPASPPPRLPLV